MVLLSTGEISRQSRDD